MQVKTHFGEKMESHLEYETTELNYSVLSWILHK